MIDCAAAICASDDVCQESVNLKSTRFSAYGNLKTYVNNSRLSNYFLTHKKNWNCEEEEKICLTDLETLGKFR